MFRTVQTTDKPKGLAILWLVGSQCDPDLRTALPGWAIVASDQGPSIVTSGDINSARSAGKAPDAPILLVGFSAGCQAVRSALVNKLVPDDNLAGVAVFDGTHGALPPLKWQVEVWSHVADLARRGLTRMVATCTQMTYTKRLATNPFSPTSEVLTLALGFDVRTTLAAPAVDGRLYVEQFPSDAEATERSKQAHISQQRVTMPHYLALVWGDTDADTIPPPTPVPDGDVITLPETVIVPEWQDPTIRFGLRCVAWSRNELAAGVREIPDGSNDSPRIRQYFDIPDLRRLASGASLRGLRGQAWCAVAASMAHHEAALAGDSPPVARVSGIEFQTAAQDAGTWCTIADWDRTIGDLAIFARPGESWNRHVTRVSEILPEGFVTIAGNESNKWQETMHKNSDPNLLGFVLIR